MKNKKGFTLLELLIVILIIGILAGIALPQYKKSVLKSKFASVKSAVRVISNSVQVYYILNNAYPTSLNEMDVEINSSNPYTSFYTNGGNVGGIVHTSDDRAYLLNYYIDYRGRTYCLAYDGTTSNNSESVRSIVKEICKHETGKVNRDWGNTKYSAYEY